MIVSPDTDSIVVVCAADNNYAMPLAVTIRSALENLKSNRKVVLFILDGGISFANRKRIMRSLNSDLITIYWLQQDNSLFENLALTRHLTAATYYRLSIPKILPQKFDKVIYLDTDMVVTGDLEELWNIDVGNNYVLAVEEIYKDTSTIKVLINLGINPEYKYFNAGLLVMNLEKWRTDNIAEKVIEYTKKNRDKVRHDQDTLNVLLAGNWGELHPKWNQIHWIYESYFREDNPFPKEDNPYRNLPEDVYNEVLNNPCITHFTSYPKPFATGLRYPECTHPRKDLFFQYLDLTAWSGWRDTIWRRLNRKFLKIIKS